jgi:hypothetical protein
MNPHRPRIDRLNLAIVSLYHNAHQPIPKRPPWPVIEAAAAGHVKAAWSRHRSKTPSEVVGRELSKLDCSIAELLAGRVSILPVSPCACLLADRATYVVADVECAEALLSEIISELV